MGYPSNPTPETNRQTGAQTRPPRHHPNTYDSSMASSSAFSMAPMLTPALRSGAGSVRDGGGRGSSPWLMISLMRRPELLALRLYGGCGCAGVAEGLPPPAWLRPLL